ncbi:hypothetical protein [Citrobacter freundii]
MNIVFNRLFECFHILSGQQQVIELVVMVRDEPEFPGGPLSAEVHPDEVDNWLALDWRLEE